MEIGDSDGKGEDLEDLEGLRLELASYKKRLAQRDREVIALNRKLRRFEDLQLLLDNLKERLTEKEREASDLVLEITRRNQQLARIRDPRARI